MSTLEYNPAILDPIELSQPETISVLLIDDQLIIAEGIRQMLVDQKDISLHYCQDPAMAIQMAEQFHPTVILQDLVMPDIDGLMLVRYFRANPGTRDVPLIVLSAEEDAKVKAQAFAIGVNDYMVKLPDRVELIARIRYHSRAYNSFLQRNEAYKRLVESQEALKRDLEDAADYVRSILPEPIDDRQLKIEWRFLPSADLGGDSFGYHWLDADHLAIYLLDVCGHGVGAALLSISVANLLRTQTLPDTDFFQPSHVLHVLNQRFQMEQQRNMFFTMWYGVYNKLTRELVYTSAGHPPAILVTGPTEAEAKTVRLNTQGLVVGAMTDWIYTSASVTIQPYNRFFVFSDGIYEVFNQEGKILDLENIIPVMEKSDLDLDAILKYAQAVNGPGHFPDDVSIIGVLFRL